MLTKTVKVIQWVEVTVDDSKFTHDFMQEYIDTFCPYHTLDDHMKHLAQLEARGLVGGSEVFIEGYGPMQEMGISMRITDQEEEIE